MTRLLNTAVPIQLEPLAAADVVSGSPQAGLHALTEVGGVEVGVWEMTPGVATDTESDEVFVVIAGSGRVVFEDGEEIGLAPGVVVRLTEGERTTWYVDEQIRKIYIA